MQTGNVQGLFDIAAGAVTGRDHVEEAGDGRLGER